MATQVQRRRGTASEHNTFTGAAGEVTVNTTNDSLHVHDGATAGGFESLRADMTNVNGEPTALEGRFLGIELLGPYDVSGDDAVAQRRTISGSSGTWSRPAGVGSVLVYVTGGGGGGQLSNGDWRGGGGGGGGTAIKFIENVPSSVSFTIGAGGQASTNDTAGAGTSSSFGSFCTGFPGRGGDDNSGGYGGGAAGGDLNLPGGSATFVHGDTRIDSGGGMTFWTQSGGMFNPNDNYGINSSHGRWGAGGGTGRDSDNDEDEYNGGAGVIVLFLYS